MSSANLNFNDDDSKYKCFWNAVHVKSATKFLCAFLFVVHIFSFIYTCVNYDAPYAVLIGIFAAIEIFAYGGVLLGIYDTNPKYFILYLLWTRFWMILIALSFFVQFVLVSSFAFSYLVGDGNSTKSLDGKVNDIKDSLRLVIYLLYTSARLLCYIFIFNIVYKCYQYVTDKAATIKEIAPPRITVTNFPEESKTLV